MGIFGKHIFARRKVFFSFGRFEVKFRDDSCHRDASCKGDYDFMLRGTFADFMLPISTLRFLDVQAILDECQLADGPMHGFII